LNCEDWKISEMGRLCFLRISSKCGVLVRHNQSLALLTPTLCKLKECYTELILLGANERLDGGG
jgi:hypothetical protein